MAADPRIERVALAMARAESNPSWAPYMSAARLHVAAFDELRAIEREREDAELLAALERETSILPEER